MTVVMAVPAMPVVVIMGSYADDNLSARRRNQRCQEQDCEEAEN
jgi:hypothetical protein